MKLCITCHRNNIKRKFVGDQCEDCYNKIPFSPPPYIPAKKIKVFESLVITTPDEEVVKKDLEKLREKNKAGLAAKKAENDRLYKERQARLIEQGIIKVGGPRYCSCGTRIRTHKDRCQKCIYNEEMTHRKAERAKRKIEKLIKPQKIYTKPQPHLSAAENLLLLPEKKVCTKCKFELHIGDFYLRSNNYPESWCKECRSQINLKWRIKNREKYLEYLKTYNKEYSKTYKRGVGKKVLNLPPIIVTLTDNN